MAKGKGKGKFDKKTAVKFTLIPGPIKQGKPTVLFKPVESKTRSKLSKKQRKNYISQLSDYEQITINGRVVGQDELPAFVLQQIRGRGELVINQKIEEEMVGDLYELEDRKDDQEDEYEEYPDYEDQRMEMIKEGKEEQDQEFQDQGDWEDDEQYDEEQEIEDLDEEQQTQDKKYTYKQQDFPSIRQLEKVEVDGITYQMTKQQIKLLDQLIPDNYEQLDFGGLQFKKYNEDGLPLSDKAKFDKYMLKDGDGTVVVDTYAYIPEKPVDIIDNDLKPSQINGNREVKQIEDALNFNGEDEAYEELEDDFFSKMIKGELQTNKVDQKKKVLAKKAKEEAKQKKELISKVAPVPQQVPKKDKVYSTIEEIQQKLLSEKLQKALYNFQNNIQQHRQDRHQQQSDEQQEMQQSQRNHSMNFTDIQKREQYIGRDGELDWRCLTKQQKKQYMKTKVIRQYYDQLRQREIQQKMAGIKNVSPDQLHLKQLVKHITYEQDHVMRKALEDQLKAPLKEEIQEESDYSQVSQDDIVSYHQKTSIIASNLSVIEEPHIKKPKKKDDDKEDEQPQENSRVKVVPEKRNKNETQQQRKQRKQRLRQMKKLKKQQKKQFAEQFSKIKRQTNKQQNHTNPLNKVSYVKIY